MTTDGDGLDALSTHSASNAQRRWALGTRLPAGQYSTLALLVVSARRGTGRDADADGARGGWAEYVAVREKSGWGVGEVSNRGRGRRRGGRRAVS
uniref:Uncharacterized protein n=1 Tax=Oryza barthii TaxID=65489 RepID=A0A0D3F8H5_9ORYZ